MYTIKLLDNVEFDKLPYKYAKSSLGLADPKINTAFVRRTGVGGLDLFTIQHEVEELAKKISSHEEDGIRYKKFAKEIFIPYVLPVLAGIAAGPAGAAAAAAAAAGTKAIAEETVGGGIERKSILPIAMAGIGGYATGAGMAPGVEVSKAAGGGYLGQIASGLQTAVGVTPGAAKTVAGLPVGGGAGSFEAVTKGLSPGALGVVQGVTAPLAGTTAPTTTNLFQKLIKGTQTAGQLGAGQLLGAALTGASALPETPGIPGYGEITRRYIGAEAKPVSEIAKLATTNITEILKSPPEEIFPVLEDPYFEATQKGIDRSFDEAVERTTLAYQRYGKLYSSEHQGALRRLEEERAWEKSRAQEEAQNRRFELAWKYKYDALARALNLSQDEMEILLTADLADAAAAFNAEVADIQSIRDALGTAGGYFMGGGA